MGEGVQGLCGRQRRRRRVVRGEGAVPSLARCLFRRCPPWRGLPSRSACQRPDTPTLLFNSGAHPMIRTSSKFPDVLQLSDDTDGKGDRTKRSETFFSLGLRPPLLEDALRRSCGTLDHNKIKSFSGYLPGPDDASSAETWLHKFPTQPGPIWGWPSVASLCKPAAPGGALCR